MERPADKDGTKNNVNMTYWLVPLVISIVGAAIGFAYIMSTKRTTSPRDNLEDNQATVFIFQSADSNIFNVVINITYQNIFFEVQ